MQPNSMKSTSTHLTSDERKQFGRAGYHFPVRIFDDMETHRFLQSFVRYRDHCRRQMEQLPINQHYQLFSDTHFVARWVYEIVTHQRILDAVESLLGENLFAWNTVWFAKMPGEKTYISWHQDGMYWKLRPFKVVTAWVALTPSMASNGCLRVVPGTHVQPALPHKETYDPDNALSRGQDVAVTVDESQAVNLELQPGEMSLHHLWIVHGSSANTSTETPRIGIAIRYVATEVKQESPAKPLALLVRGRDDYGHFEILPPPSREDLQPGDPQHVEIIRRIRESVMQNTTTDR